MIKPDINIMKAAIEVAESNQTPFGAALAMGSELFAAAANQTKKLHDPTAHAEVMVIRKLCSQLKKTDLSGFTLYTTCEPCPMCMSAAIWAKIDHVIYGCDIPTISGQMDQINLRSVDLTQYCFYEIEVKGGILEEQCRSLLMKYS